MKPRYRKSAPEFKKFKSEQEEILFMRAHREAEKALLKESGTFLKPFGFKETNHTNLSENYWKGVEKLVDKIDKFCPHFSTFIPTFKHMLLPAIGVGCCMECLVDFVPLLLANDTGCDLCGVGGKTDMYVEISIPIGYGSLVVNLGAYCCADIFTKS